MYISVSTCRPDKTRKASHQAPVAGCGVNALSDLHSGIRHER
ncbi:hypothetical protein HMPREF1589_01625 [Escherichia coli 113290]|nr:hypothetical protein HMPREF1589_01625 [Escherichia coli 113290]